MILFFDTETNGLPANFNAPVTDIDNWPRLIEVAWILCEKNLSEVSRQSFLVRPVGFDIPVESSDVHGITKEIALADGVKLETVLDSFCEACQDVSMIVGHNIEFDRNIIGAELIRSGLQDVLKNKVQLCTMKTSVQYCALDSGHSGYKWPSLAELYFKLFEKRIDNAHSAMVDVRATKNCFAELINRDIIALPANFDRTELLERLDEEEKDVNYLIERASDIWNSDPNQAKSDLENVIKTVSGPQLAAAHFLMAVIKEFFNESDDDYHLRKALEIWPDFVGALEWKGQIKFGREAIEALDRAIALKPRNAQLYLTRAERRGELAFFDLDFDNEFAEKNYVPENERILLRDKALSDYEQAIQLKPDFWEAFVSRAEFKLSEDFIQFETNSLQEKVSQRQAQSLRAVIEDLETVEKHQKEPKADLYLCLGRALLKEKKYSRAKEMFSKAIQLSEEAGFINEDAYYFRSKVHQVGGGGASPKSLREAEYDLSAILEPHESDFEREEGDDSLERVNREESWKSNGYSTYLVDRAKLKASRRDYEDAIRDYKLANHIDNGGWSVINGHDVEIVKNDENVFAISSLYLKLKDYRNTLAFALKYVNMVAPYADEKYEPYCLRPLWGLDLQETDDVEGVLKVARAFDMIRHCQAALGFEDEHNCLFYYHKFQGYAYAKMKDWLGAERSLSKALDLNSDDFELYHQRSKVRENIEYLSGSADFTKSYQIPEQIYGGEDEWESIKPWKFYEY